MQNSEQDVGVLKIRSINKIAYLRAMGVSELGKYVENLDGKNKVVYIYEDNQEVKKWLDLFYRNIELKETLGNFKNIKNEMYQLIKGLE